MRVPNIRQVVGASMLAVSAMTMVACTTTERAPHIDSATMNQNVSATLERLYASAPGSRELVARSAGVLVFPSVVGGSFVVGVEHGRGMLRTGNANGGFYATTGASIGWQAGGQSRAVIYVFNTTAALNDFKNSEGWSVGGDATVAVGRVGANGSVDTTTINSPVSSFVLTNVGLELGVSLQGARITKVGAP